MFCDEGRSLAAVPVDGWNVQRGPLAAGPRGPSVKMTSEGNRDVTAAIQAAEEGQVDC